MLTMTNSTLSGNTATTGNGGGLFTSGAPAKATLINVTITDNHAANAGGAHLLDGDDVLRNTIVAGNYQGPGTSTPSDLGGVMDTSANSSNNLIGTGGSAGLTNGVNGNQVGVANALLGVLANNGGATFTHALLAGSPAIEAGTEVTTLNGGIDSVTTSVTVTDATAFVAGVGFVIRIDDVW